MIWEYALGPSALLLNISNTQSMIIKLRLSGLLFASSLWKWSVHASFCSKHNFCYDRQTDRFRFYHEMKIIICISAQKKSSNFLPKIMPRPFSRFLAGDLLPDEVFVTEIMLTSFKKFHFFLGLGARWVVVIKHL